jgi:hypothetical protein
VAQEVAAAGAEGGVGMIVLAAAMVCLQLGLIGYALGRIAEALEKKL